MNDEHCLDFRRLLSSLRQVETIAEGASVRARDFLTKTYGPGRWRKMKGVARVETFAGEIFDAEVHRFEAHGIGRRRFKIKHPLN